MQAAVAPIVLAGDSNSRSAAVSPSVHILDPVCPPFSPAKGMASEKSTKNKKPPAQPKAYS